MVPVIFADCRKINLALYPKTLQQSLVTDPGKFKDLRRIDSPARHNDILVDLGGVSLFVGEICYAGSTIVPVFVFGVRELDFSDLGERKQM